MTQNCTVYINSEKAEELITLVEYVAPKGAISIKGNNDNWKSISYVSEEVSLTINRMVRVEPGDEFSRLILSTHTFAKRLDSQNPELHKSLLQALLKSSQILGVVAEPAFDEKTETLILELARKGKGIIFTGSEFLNYQAGLILDLEGNSEANVLA